MLKYPTCRALALGLALAALPAIAHDVISVDYAEPLRLLPATSEVAKGEAPSARRMRFDAFGRRFDLRLTRNLSLVGDGMTELVDVAWKGELAGLDDSWARISDVDGVPQGLIHDGETLYAIELRDGSDVPVVYRVEDLRIAPGALSCPTHGPAHVHTGEELVAEIAEANRPRVAFATGASQQIEIGVIADAGFANRQGANAEAALVARMNTVDGIYSRQLGLQFNANIQVFDDASDPFSDVTVAGDLLDEVRDFRRNSSTQQQYGLTHLFTDRNLDGTTAGIAYLDVVCSRSFGVSLTQSTFGAVTESLVAAHEFGHNFGSPHDGEAACAAEPDDQFLMAPRVSSSPDFSSCSIGIIAQTISEASCISPLALGTEIGLAPLPVSDQALSNTPVDIGFRAVSTGDGPVTNPTVTALVGDGLTLDGVTSTTGQCTTNAGTAECTTMMLQPGATMEVVLTVQAATAGTRTIEASVSSPDDTDADNNTAQVQVITRAAVDLAVAASSGDATVGSPVTVAVTVENNSNDDASAVALNVTPGLNLTLNSASWQAGNCTIVENTASCVAAGLGAGEQEQLQLRFTGTAAGTLEYTVDASTTTTDINGSNDSATGQITVSTATNSNTGGGGSGGGGNIDPWLLLLLSLLAVNRGRRRA